MFIGDEVKINYEGTNYHGLVGVVENIWYENEDIGFVYLIRYTNGNGGMFKESQLIKNIKEEL